MRASRDIANALSVNQYSHEWTKLKDVEEAHSGWYDCYEPEGSPLVSTRTRRQWAKGVRFPFDGVNPSSRHMSGDFRQKTDARIAIWCGRLTTCRFADVLPKPPDPQKCFDHFHGILGFLV